VVAQLSGSQSESSGDASLDQRCTLPIKSTRIIALWIDQPLALLPFEGNGQSDIFERLAIDASTILKPGN